MEASESFEAAPAHSHSAMADDYAMELEIESEEERELPDRASSGNARDQAAEPTMCYPPGII